MTHAAIQVRDAVIALLQASPTFTDKVGHGGKVPRSDEHLPYTAVSLGNDDPRRQGTGPNATIVTDDEIVLTYLVKESGDVEAVAFALDLAAQKLLADNRLLGLLQSIAPGPRIRVDRAQLDLPCYALQRIFRVRYQNKVTTPDITF